MLYVIAATMKQATYWCGTEGRDPRSRDVAIITSARGMYGLHPAEDDEVVVVRWPSDSDAKDRATWRANLRVTHDSEGRPV